MTAVNQRSEPMSVEFKDVTKSYGDGPNVLKNFNLNIEAGDLVTILGPSGCGKTTSLRILAGFEDTTSGDVLVGGKSVLNIPPSKRNMGMVFQSYSLFPNLTVADNIEYGLQIRGMKGPKRGQPTDELLELIGLPEFGDRFPHQLSGGQQQRVALARALAIEPQVLLLDEPLSALDAAVRTNLREEIRRIQKSSGITTVFITHDQAEALVIADKVAVMNKGIIEQYSTPDELYERPETVFTARFIGTINEFHVPNAWDVSQRIKLELANEHKSESLVFVRPEALSLVPSEHSAAVVSTQQYLGERTMVRVEHPQARGGYWTVSLSPQDASAVPPGTRVDVNVINEIAMRKAASEVDA